jgi:hypothetical protein
MGRFEKTVNRLLRGTSDSNFPFKDLCWLLKKLNFDERVSGSHHIFSHEVVPDIINLQPKKSKAKDYQVKQVRRILTEYELISDEVEGDD